MNSNYTGSPMVSLFDYQGRPDYDKIGKKVYEYAKHRKAKIESRKLGPKYGNITVMLYPSLLLDEYFELRKQFSRLTKYF